LALDIIGAGFGRTGTNSLKLALEHLGFGPCHHMFEVRDNPEQLPGWVAAAQGEPVDWEEIFRGYRSQVDWPGARYWRELTAHYPDAKVILSVRDPDAWFESVQATIAPFLDARGNHSTAYMNAIADMAYETVAASVFHERLSDRAHAIAVFNDHIAQVQAEIPAQRLLVFDVADGWGPLAAFLGVDEPDIPFPKTNSSQQFNREEWKEN
jgi:hypothetical protein